MDPLLFLERTLHLLQEALRFLYGFSSWPQHLLAAHRTTPPLHAMVQSMLAGMDLMDAQAGRPSLFFEVGVTSLTRPDSLPREGGGMSRRCDPSLILAPFFPDYLCVCCRITVPRVSRHR